MAKVPKKLAVQVLAGINESVKVQYWCPACSSPHLSILEVVACFKKSQPENSKEIEAIFEQMVGDYVRGKSSKGKPYLTVHLQFVFNEVEARSPEEFQAALKKYLTPNAGVVSTWKAIETTLAVLITAAFGLLSGYEAYLNGSVSRAVGTTVLFLAAYFSWVVLSRLSFVTAAPIARSAGYKMLAVIWVLTLGGLAFHI